MCFSATASFSAGVVLTVIGIASIKKTKTPSQLLFASIPFVFGVQQITEGFVWLSLTQNAFASLQHIATYNFIFFAQVVWPVWVPLAILKLEPKTRQRNVEKILVSIGAMVSLYLAYCLFNFPVQAKILNYHISYQQGYPHQLSLLCGALYIVSTILPPFISRFGRMKYLGTTILISYLITAIFYNDYLISVWCFFASVISLAVFFVLHGINHYKHHDIKPAVL